MCKTFAMVFNINVSNKIKIGDCLDIVSLSDCIDIELPNKIYSLDLAELPNFTEKLAVLISLAFDPTQ